MGRLLGPNFQRLRFHQRTSNFLKSEPTTKEYIVRERTLLRWFRFSSTQSSGRRKKENKKDESVANSVRQKNVLHTAGHHWTRRRQFDGRNSNTSWQIVNKILLCSTTCRSDRSFGWGCVRHSTFPARYSVLPFYSAAFSKFISC